MCVHLLLLTLRTLEEQVFGSPMGSMKKHRHTTGVMMTCFLGTVNLQLWQLLLLAINAWCASSITHHAYPLLSVFGEGAVLLET